MCKQVAVILDTNFIYAKAKQMDSLLQKLNEDYEVYITQISVDERKEQMCREFSKNYIDVKRFYSEFSYVIPSPNFISTDDALSKLKKGMQKKYESAFPKHIIPFNSSKELLEMVLDRANRKISPFSADEKASDKGFKDTLIWLSILEYFKLHGEKEVIFVSNDGGFRKETAFLCQEFKEYTGKVITIKDSNFYDAVEPKIQESKQKNLISIPPDINQIRERVQDVISGLCITSEYDYWGVPELRRTFKLSEQVDSTYIQVVFDTLKEDITNNLFAISVPADKILALDDRVDNLTSIPMEALEKALSLYEDIKNNMPDFLNQFYRASADIINGNYVEPVIGFESLEDDDLPF